ncbi:MAG TPA: nucleotidyltransferase family protein [Armatimonadota bacterium]|jgi:hypothetical protein
MLKDLNIPIKKIEDLCRRYKVAELAVFGSAVREDFRADSDIDLLVSFQPDAKIGLIAFIGLQQQLEELLGRRVDLVSKRGLKPLIRDEVLTSAKVLYAA